MHRTCNISTYIVDARLSTRCIVLKWSCLELQCTTSTQCGYSSKVAGVLNYMEVDYQDVNVLADENIRQGIKDYSDWPTIPQLYVKGEFVGGCDIITEMTMSGELDTMFDENEIKYDKDAADKIRESNA